LPARGRRSPLREPESAASPADHSDADGPRGHPPAAQPRRTRHATDTHTPHPAEPQDSDHRGGRGPRGHPGHLSARLWRRRGRHGRRLLAALATSPSSPSPLRLTAVGSIVLRRGVGICVAVLAFGLAAAPSIGAAPSSRPTAAEATGAHPCGARPASTKPYKHIVVIMDENLSVPQGEATHNAPYTHRRAEECRPLTGAAGETHPSFP